MRLLLKCVAALRIHLSEDAQKAVVQFPGFEVEPRGQTSVKVFIETFLKEKL